MEDFVIYQSPDKWNAHLNYMNWFKNKGEYDNTRQILQSILTKRPNSTLSDVSGELTARLGSNVSKQILSLPEDTLIQNIYDTLQPGAQIKQKSLGQEQQSTDNETVESNLNYLNY